MLMLSMCLCTNHSTHIFISKLKE
uniref:Uncharacterized protein n=1 Tax=Arundo donax TaxID=35708 RepID=A0A0A9FM78_ARUDO